MKFLYSIQLNDENIPSAINTEYKPLCWGVTAREEETLMACHKIY